MNSSHNDNDPSTQKNTHQDEFDTFLSSAAEQARQSEVVRDYIIRLEERFHIDVAAGNLPPVAADSEMDELIQNSIIKRALMVALSYDLDDPDKIGTIDAPSEKQPWIENPGKSRLIAELIIVDQFEPDNPWIELINDSVPGKRFDIESPSAQTYLLAAYEAYANLKTKQEESSKMLRDIFDIAGIDKAEAAKTNEGAKAATLLMQQISEAVTRAMLILVTVERESMWRDWARTTNLETAQINAILAIINDSYPTIE